MNRLKFWLIIIFILQFVLVDGLLAQGKKYEGPDDPAGDIAAEREGYMTGNRVFLYFRNTTELSDWPKVEVSRWPNNYEGVKMLDGIGLLIGALVFVKNDSVPVTDPAEILSLRAQGKLDTLYYLQTSYREEMDLDPTGKVEWGLYPVFGYFNELNEYPAMSNIPKSWPAAGWPATGRSFKWPGEWDGRFGRGVIYADMETYFVANDAQDQEYLGAEDKLRYKPRPGRYIGDIRPNVTIQKGLPWGGVGIRVEQRGFQWNNPQARDAIFWEYNISNISDYDIRDVAFGYWVDNAIGDAIAGSGDDDELGFFDTKIDMAYSWDIDGIGQGGFRTGTMGFAYLESPGLPYDFRDNDEDGLTDEKRDNVAQNKVGPTEGITNLANFLDFYRLQQSDLREHWDADEDQDWEDGEDLDGDGIYQTNESAGDDVGLDGVGPNDINYTGPDEGECNHRPDYKEGVGCEPNFAETDVTESDMVGLTSFLLFPVPKHVPPYTRWFRNDKSMWQVVGRDTLIESVEWISNLIEVFASGPFPLFQGRTERISMSELHSYDPLEGLSSEDHTAPALFQQKRIVQIIYEKDYRFAQPPRMPTLTATPGDGKVILAWDDHSDTKTRDPFLGNVNDFEGYKLFRATDKKMSDAEVITDGYGTPMFKKPIFQCDVKDGRLGFTNFGLVNGMGYYLGEDTGITHYFVDTNVQNGRTYYYGIIAYDYGAPEIGPGISPSENNLIIELDESENVRGYGKNVQIVTPHQMAAGYLPPSAEPDKSIKTIGSGTVEMEILAKNALKLDHTYKVKFGLDTIYTVKNDPRGIIYTNNSLKVFDVTDNNRLAYEENPSRFSGTNLIFRDSTEYTGWSKYWYINPSKEIRTDIFDGIRLKINIPVAYPEVDYLKSGWVIGKSPINVVMTTPEFQYYPWDYVIVYTNNDSAYKSVTNPSRIYDEAHKRINRNDLLLQQKYNFFVLNKTFSDSLHNFIFMDIIVHDQLKNGTFDPQDDRILVGSIAADGTWSGTAFAFDFKFATPSTLPQPGDIYYVSFNRPFWSKDSLQFTIKDAGEVDLKAMETTMKEIRVVPNPYVATNAMETSVANWYLNQRRQIMFVNLPARCTIKIFTISGILVDEFEVENVADDGIAHWDLVSKEGLDIAAGMYLYHVEAKDIDFKKMGKFAIIK